MSIINTILNVFFWVIFFIGFFFIGYILVFQVWPKVAYKFKPKSFKAALKHRKAEARLKAKQQGKQPYVLNKDNPDKKITIWATSLRRAQRKYKQLSTKKRPKEIF
ncbi:hypothetical protein [Flavobacteriaceae bacterium 14752]|uniref:hypothetical protein n=1 Tax=Mesohalobacter salilacus TaxID=2491711 RepID=UPI000F62CFCC|nr:hypothetical protein EIG84_05840 [Flavobacteriaceae bacterium 14752]